MPIAPWNEKSSIGLEAVDSQHFVLFEILSDLEMSIMKGQPRSVLDALLDKFVNYAAMHFASEEAMMSASGYPHAEAHKAMHRQLLREAEQKIAQGKASIDSTRSAVHPKFLLYLRDWVTNHIQTADLAFGEWMGEKGME